jgi:hypothetical protein
MIRALILFMVAAGMPAAAQTGTPADPQMTQALLTEIRGLRQDLQNTAAVIQRVQIVMYRLQAQTAMVTRASQRLDDARNRCNGAQQLVRMRTSQIAQMEDQVRNGQTPADRKRAEDTLPTLKADLEHATTDEQQCHMRESEADSQWRSEQQKMSMLEDQLDKIDKVLSNVGK